MTQKKLAAICAVRGGGSNGLSGRRNCHKRQRTWISFSELMTEFQNCYTSNNTLHLHVSVLILAHCTATLQLLESEKDYYCY